MQTPTQYRNIYGSLQGFAPAANTNRRKRNATRCAAWAARSAAFTASRAQRGDGYSTCALPQPANPDAQYWVAQIAVLRSGLSEGYWSGRHVVATLMARLMDKVYYHPRPDMALVARQRRALIAAIRFYSVFA